MKTSIERENFSSRLQQALRNAHYSPESPTQLVREFNVRFAGRPITVHAARKWLVGESCTIADLGCFGRSVFMAEGGMSLDKRPHAAAWRERIMAMPGFALPYDLIPKKDTEFSGL